MHCECQGRKQLLRLLWTRRRNTNCGQQRNWKAKIVYSFALSISILITVSGYMEGLAYNVSSSLRSIKHKTKSHSSKNLWKEMASAISKIVTCSQKLFALISDTNAYSYMKFKIAPWLSLRFWTLAGKWSHFLIVIVKGIVELSPSWGFRLNKIYCNVLLSVNIIISLRKLIWLDITWPTYFYAEKAINDLKYPPK